MKEKVFSSWWTGSDACAPASYLRARAAGRRRRNARRIARGVCAAPDDEGVHHSERARPRDHLRVACRQHREEGLLQLLVEPRAQRGHAAHGDVRRRRLHVAVGGPPAVRRRVRLGRLDRRPALVGRQQRAVAREHGAALLDRRARPVDGAVGLVPRVHDLDGRRVRLEVGPGVRQPVRRGGVAVVVRAAVAAERERRRAEHLVPRQPSRACAEDALGLGVLLRLRHQRAELEPAPRQIGRHAQRLRLRRDRLLDRALLGRL